LKAPDMYMEKLMVGPEVKGLIDLNLPIEQNLRRVASKLGKLLSDLSVMVLDKPRHSTVIEKMHELGVRVFTIPDGDVAASVLCCLPEAEVDMVYGIGGAPEGVVAAEEVRRCQEMGVEVNTVLQLEQLVRDDNLVFAATGITNSDLLKGIHRKGNLATTETLLIRGKSRTIRRIQSTHYLDRKDTALYRLINA
ncbi:fructose-bisphosphatase class II, partial [Aggregatibacter actinomycetemcomitans]